MFRKRRSEKPRRMRMSARKLLVDRYPELFSFTKAARGGALSKKDKESLRYDMGGILTKRLHNDNESRYVVMDFCANLYNFIITKLKGKILNVLFEGGFPDITYQSLFAGGTFLTDQEFVAFQADNTFPYKFNIHYGVLIDHLFGVICKGGTNANYHLAKYNIEHQIWKKFEEERAEVGPLTDYDFNIVVNPYLNPMTRDAVVATIRQFFGDETEIRSIIDNTLKYHPIREEVLNFKIGELIKETLLVQGERLETVDASSLIAKKSDFEKVQYKQVGDLKRIFIEPFNVDPNLMPGFNPIAELFDFDCRFDFSNNSFEQPSFGCKTPDELKIKLWKHWIEVRKTPIESYSEYILKVKPQNEFVDFYLQTLDITIADLVNTIERTKGVDNVKLEKRRLRLQVMNRIKDSLLGELPPGRPSVNEDVEMVECSIQKVESDEMQAVKQLLSIFIEGVNSGKVRDLSLSSNAAFTFNYNGDVVHASDPESVYRLFDIFHTNNYKLSTPYDTIFWDYNESGVLDIQVEGLINKIGDAYTYGFQMRIFLLSSDAQKWTIIGGEIRYSSI